MFNLDNFSIVSEVRNAQVTFVEQPKMKKKSVFKQQTHAFILDHTKHLWIPFSMEGPFKVKENNIVKYLCF